MQNLHLSRLVVCVRLTFKLSIWALILLCTLEDANATEWLGGSLTTGVNCTVTPGNQIDCFGLTVDNTVVRTSPTISPGSWTSISGVVATAPNCVANSASRFDCFALGVGAMLHIALLSPPLASTRWNVVATGGPISTAPSCVLASPPQIDCFAAGTDAGTDNVLLHTRCNSSLTTADICQAWQRLRDSPQLSGAPTCLSRDANLIDCFASASDFRLVHISWDGSRWSDWENLGGNIKAPLSCTSWAPGRLDCFGRSTDNSLRHIWWDTTFVRLVIDRDSNGRRLSRPRTSHWGRWDNLGGSLQSGPSCTSWGPDRIDCFAADSGGLLSHRWWDGNAWGGWETIEWKNPGTAVGSRPGCFPAGGGGSCAVNYQTFLASDPECVSVARYHVDCFARTTDGVLVRWSNQEAADMGQDVSAGQPYPFVPGLYTIGAKGTGHCVGRWPWGSQSLQLVDCATPNAQVALVPGPLNPIGSNSIRSGLYLIRPAFIRSDETAERPPGDLSLCAKVSRPAIGAWQIQAQQCFDGVTVRGSKILCPAAGGSGMDDEFVQFIDHGGFDIQATPFPLAGLGHDAEVVIQSEAAWSGYWAVRDARVDLSADIIIWDPGSYSGPPGGPWPPRQYLFELQLQHPFSETELEALNCPPAVSGTGGWNFSSATQEWRYLPIAANVRYFGSLISKTQIPGGPTTDHLDMQCARSCADNIVCRFYSFIPNDGGGECTQWVASPPFAPGRPQPLDCSTCSSGIVRR